MNQRIQTLEEIFVALTELRSKSESRRKFPNELWMAIIHWAQVQSIEEVCNRLKINPIYLKRKMRQLQGNALDFQEICFREQVLQSGRVVIELLSNHGLKAKIEGDSSCLNYLVSLFKE
jgi:hypothetical protein